ncbi:MAG: V-type ATPase subunit [Syntrophorhabdaceae bacterium]|nr:V-type ATPase subunit [Syntrophorhabdaceae bacterium]
MHDYIAEDKEILEVRKKAINAPDLDYLTSLLHARYSKMAKGDRLLELSRIQNITDFFQSVYPERAIENNYTFQKRCIYDFITEIYSFYAYLPENYINFLNWIATRFQLENLKILLRGFLTETPLFRLKHFIINLPGELSLNIKKLVDAEDIEGFIKYTPKGFFQDTIKSAFQLYGNNAKPFFIEAFLDSAYFKELILKMNRLNQSDRAYIKPVVDQEIDIFHLMLITRGRFLYDLIPDQLKPLHVEGTAIQKRIFTSLLGELDPAAVIKALERRVIDIIPSELSKIEQSPPDLSILESYAWKRFYRLCNKVFYQNHMGFGCIIGYIGLRRIEILNLIALSEGISGGYGSDYIRKHLVLRDYIEGLHV